MGTIRLFIGTTILLAFTGCDGKDDSARNAESTSNLAGSSVNITSSQSSTSSDGTRLKISDVVFKSEMLAHCVRLATQNSGITYTEELVSLNCNNNGKSMAVAMNSDPMASGDLPNTVISIEGLELFNNLEHLELRGNWLQTVDLTPFKKLQYLDLSDTIIRELDLSANTQLQTVNLNAVALTKLDVAGLGQLKSLSLMGDQLDFYFNFVLETPDTSQNFAEYGGGVTLDSLAQPIAINGFDDLTALEIFKSSQHLLPNVSVDDQLALTQLTVTDAGLTGIDLTNHTQLAVVELSNNSLTSLKLTSSIKNANLSNNKLTEFAVNGDSKLETLDLSYNNLTDFDFSATSPLTRLIISNNSLQRMVMTNADNLTYFAANSAFANNYAPTTLDQLIGLSIVSSNALTLLSLVDAPLTEFDSALYSGLNNVNQLTLSDVKLSAINVSTLTKLESLTVDNMGLSMIDVSANTELSFLSASNNALTTIDLSTQKQRSRCPSSTSRDRDNSCYFPIALSGNPIPETLITELKQDFPYLTFNP